jgi:uncharacterized protein DUF4157
MESRFAHDFSQVRVHTGSKAGESARAVGAEAYTVGQSIVFGEGRYTTGNQQGIALLAHELAHTVQQSASGRHLPSQTTPEDDPAEREAEAVATRVTGGVRSAAPMDTRHRTTVRVSRKKTEWPAWHQEALAAIARIAGPSDGKPADTKWSRIVTYLCALPAARARSLVDRLGPDAAGLKAGTDDFAVYVRNKFPARHADLIDLLRTLADGKVPKECEAKKEDDRPKDDHPKDDHPKEEEPEPPKGANRIKDCNPAQEKSIQSAISRALQDLDSAIIALHARPLGVHARNAMFVVFRTEDERSTLSVAQRLEKIRAGLPTATIECDQVGDIGLCSTEGTQAFTNRINKAIHLCMGEWDDADATRHHPRALIHEGAHAFAGASGPESYFDDHCEDQDETAGLPPSTRLELADGLACIVYHLTHRTAEEVAGTKELYSGEALKQLVQIRKGPISLDGPASKPYFFPFKVPVVIATNVQQGGGFAYRWRLFDDSGRHYLLRGHDNDKALDWFEFTDQTEAIIGRKTRDLLKERGVKKGVIECTVRIPERTNKTVRLDVEFTP